MERVWRKVNQGLSNTTSTLLKQSRNNNNRTSNSNYNFGDAQAAAAAAAAAASTANVRHSASIQIEDGPVYANVPQYNRGWGYIDTSKCRKRRRKVKSRRNSSKEKHGKNKNADKSKSTTKETSLRERAVAKLKILNFNINWDVHMKPCGSRVNTNILTRRLCRNRSCDDNELYRSNSFKFERFRRDDTEAAIVSVNTLPKQVDVCDYSLPLDFVKKRPTSLEQCRDVKFADDFPSPTTIFTEQQILPTASIKETRPLLSASTSASTAPKVLLNYCEPKDSKKPKKKSSVKSIKYLSDSSLPNSTDEEYNRAESKYDSSESIADSYLNNEPEYANQERSRPPPPPPAPNQLNSNPNLNLIPNFNTDTVNSKSPYYYADLLPGAKSQTNTNTQRSLKANTVVSSTSTAPKKFKSFLDDPPSPDLNLSPPQAHGRKRNGNYQRRHSINDRDTFSSTTSDDSNCSECRKRRELQHHLQQSQDESFCVSAEYDREEEVPSPAPNEFPCDTRAYIEADSQDVTEDDEMAPHRLLGHSCICSTEPSDEAAQYRSKSKSIFYVHQQGEDHCADCSVSNVNERSYSCESDLMSAGKRRIQVYETAFDSTVPLSGSDEHCDIEERIRNIMIVDPEYVRSNEHKSETKGGHQFNCDYHKNRQISENRNVASTSCNSTSSKNLAAAGRYASHSPPSTAPMPIKFPEKHDQMLFRDSNQSAPELPLSNATPHHHHGHGHVHGPNEHPKATKKLIQKKKCSHAPERVKQVRKSKRRQKTQNQSGPHKYSSTESLSSSEGSVESIHSSASDGNRSSISSGSRHSASLSSHSSDSGARVRYPLRAPVIVHANMNILSPISDKSIQESSEMFAAGASRKNLQLFNENATGIVSVKELNKQTSVDMMLLENQKSNKRRLQNRASLLLKDEIQGSDSGISLQSRDDSKIKSLALPNLNGGQPKPESQASNQTINNSGLSLPDDNAQLPFDMPKLRRNILLSEQKQSTSGSATSVDLGDLPFDMPKLNRQNRLRAQSGDAAPSTLDPNNMSHASSSLSMRDENRMGSGRKNLSLQFNRTSLMKNDGMPNERGLHLNLFSAKNNFDIDTALALDRQGWYHGALTRIEAESTLRPLMEGSFLVRNCESARNDFSLSLKSAKGFMHMRIQQNENNKFILGEFSQPFDSVPDIIKHFCLNRLPVRGAEHMCLIEPVIAQLL